jgi:hypothetical protein
MEAICSFETPEYPRTTQHYNQEYSSLNYFMFCFWNNVHYTLEIKALSSYFAILQKLIIDTQMKEKPWVACAFSEVQCESHASLFTSPFGFTVLALLAENIWRISLSGICNCSLQVVRDVGFYSRHYLFCVLPSSSSGMKFDDGDDQCFSLLFQSTLWKGLTWTSTSDLRTCWNLIFISNWRSFSSMLRSRFWMSN